MRTVVITDGKYRASIAAVRTLGRAGYRVVVVQTRGDAALTPPVFSSRYAAECLWLPGSASDPAYPDRLEEVLIRYPRPVLLCTGAASLNAVSWQKERFFRVCDFLIASPTVLGCLNDKALVHRRCRELGIPVPKQYAGIPARYPVVVKPRCGEKYGLKAADRYWIAEDEPAWRSAMRAVSAWDPDPIVQEKLEGDGVGISLLLGKDGSLLSALCHRRIREYPISGGPSSCCESFYDGRLIETARRLLHSFGFQGLAMVEFKDGRVLEVNPRIWGSFPLTEKTGSPMVLNYLYGAMGKPIAYVPQDYAVGVRMRFLLNDTAALLSLLRHGRFRAFFAGIPDCFRAAEALSSRDDPAPMRRYLRGVLLGR